MFEQIHEWKTDIVWVIAVQCTYTVHFYSHTYIFAFRSDKNVLYLNIV